MVTLFYVFKSIFTPKSKVREIMLKRSLQLLKCACLGEKRKKFFFECTVKKMREIYIGR